MKVSVLTPTYNRGRFLKKLYKSLIINYKYNVQIEWLIMDDGSTDNTKIIVDKFIKENIIDIKYYYQKNQGKMVALNNLIQYVTGDIIIECDSDDYFTENAFETVNNAYAENKKESDIYALCFLKYDKNNKNIGKNFKNKKTTMFDLYFKEGEDGEKALAYFTDKRLEYSYELEENERFVTEARMHHKMDLKYKIKCYNDPIMICEYQKDGYTKNISEIFKENPKGYYEYFREIFDHNMKGVHLKKRLYVIKHYILFATLTKNKNEIINSKGLLNKFLVALLLIPGRIATKMKIK